MRDLDKRIPEPLRDETWIRQRYLGDGLTQQQIADEIGCNRLTVLRAMQRLEIAAKDSKKQAGEGIIHPELYDERWLRRQYVENGLTTRKIARLIGSDSGNVYRALKQFGITTKKRGDGRRGVPVDVKLGNSTWLRKQYWDEDKSLSDVAKSLGTGAATVLKWMVFHGISRKPRITKGSAVPRKWVEKQKRNTVYLHGRAHPRFGKSPSHKCSRGKGGFRDDLGHHVRSTWEANVARVLRFLGVRYEYESERFDLGDRTYTPDFYLLDAGIFIEVSGYVSEEKTAKLRLMKERFPDITILHIDGNLYDALVGPFVDVVNLEVDRRLKRTA